MGISYIMLEDEYIASESFSHTKLNGGLLAILVMAPIGVVASKLI